MIKVHTVVLSDGSRNFSYVITGTKTNAKGNEVPYSKADARAIAIRQLWADEFEGHLGKRIGETSVQQLSLCSDDYKWHMMDMAIGTVAHKVKAIREGDVSTKRNADGTKKRRRNAPKVDAPAPAPAPKVDAPAPKVETPAPALDIVTENDLLSYLASCAA